MWFLLEGEPLTSMQAPHPPTFALWVGLVLARWPPAPGGVQQQQRNLEMLARPSALQSFPADPRGF